MTKLGIGFSGVSGMHVCSSLTANTYFSFPPNWHSDLLVGLPCIVSTRRHSTFFTPLLWDTTYNQPYIAQDLQIHVDTRYLRLHTP